MFQFERKEKDTLHERFREEPKHLIVLTGPRQCGKTTVLLQALESGTTEYTYVDFGRPDVAYDNSFADPISSLATNYPVETTASQSNQSDAVRLVSIWQAARIQADQSDSGFILALDQIQKIPNWSQIVKGLWDADRIHGRQMHVVLIWSVPHLMQEGLTESLAGRFEMIQLNHWSYSEMAAAFNFDLEQYIYFGGYPGSASLIDNEDHWRDYVLNSVVQTSIERDILALQRIEKSVLMNQLFEVCSHCSGQVLSYNKMLRSLQDAGSATTLMNYLYLLSQVKLITGVSKYSFEYLHFGSALKMVIHNTALMSARFGYTFNKAMADRTFWRQLVKCAVGAHLVNSLSTRSKLYYWRDDNFEVDFVVARANKLCAIEVKSELRPSAKKGFQEFERQFNNSERTPKLFEVDVSGTQLAEFLATPASEWLEG